MLRLGKHQTTRETNFCLHLCKIKSNNSKAFEVLAALAAFPGGRGCWLQQLKLFLVEAGARDAGAKAERVTSARAAQPLLARRRLLTNMATPPEDPGPESLHYAFQESGTMPSLEAPKPLESGGGRSPAASFYLKGSSGPAQTLQPETSAFHTTSQFNAQSWLWTPTSGQVLGGIRWWP